MGHGLLSFSTVFYLDIFGAILYSSAAGQVFNQFTVSVKYIWFSWIVLVCYFSDLKIFVARPFRLWIHRPPTYNNL